MLRFAVVDAGRAAWGVKRACLYGPDDAPIQGQISLTDGHIECVKPGGEPASLSIQVLVDPHSEAPLGRLTLRTTLLPEREKPYLLSLELARHRIMLFLNKLEDWGLFDLPPSHPVMARFEQAREVFTRALVVGASDLRESDRLAHSALALAIDASERLALVDAERNLRGRFSGEAYQQAVEHAARSEVSDGGPPKGLVKSPDGVGVVLSALPKIGCNVPPAAFGEAAQRVVSGVSDFIAVPMRWSEMEPGEGKYNFAPTDRWIEWAVRVAKLPVVAGPLIDLRAICVPEWLYIWENDYETLREMVYEHLRHVVTRYRRTVGVWSVASGLHVNENFSLTFEHMMDLTRMCVLVVRKLQPTARVVLEIAQPYGEYYARNRRAMPPLLYGEMVAQANINVDAIGLRLQMGDPNAARDTRDLMAVSELLDRYAALDRPIHLTAVGAPSEPIAPPDDDPGFWRTPWSEERQAEWLSRVLAIAAGKPYVQSICWQELCDLPGGEMPLGGIMTGEGRPKPAARSLESLRRSLLELKLPSFEGM